MTNDMIEGVNPLVISRITWKQGYRIGWHPRKNRLMRKKNPIRGFFGLYNEELFDGWNYPTVIIYGSDGDILRVVSVRSNAAAKARSRELNEQLSSFINSLKVKND